MLSKAFGNFLVAAGWLILLINHLPPPEFLVWLLGWLVLVGIVIVIVAHVTRANEATREVTEINA